MCEIKQRINVWAIVINVDHHTSISFACSLSVLIISALDASDSLSHFSIIRKILSFGGWVGGVGLPYLCQTLLVVVSPCPLVFFLFDL